MTREEAIKVLQSTYDDFCQYDNPDDYYAKVLEAREMAIQALQTESCEDAISRHAVLDMAYTIPDEYFGTRNVVSAEKIKELPSVTPQIQISNEDYGKIYEKFKQALHNNPQEVIRCKDCNFAHMDCADNWHCNRVDESSFFVEENGFCAWAEVKMEVK